MSHASTCESRPHPSDAHAAADVLPDRLPRRVPLTVVTSETSGGALVEPDGELDVATVPLLTSAVGAVLNASRALVRIDVSRTTLLDATALRALLALRDRVAAAGSSLVLTGSPRPVVARALVVSGVWNVLPWAPPEVSGDDD